MTRVLVFGAADAILLGLGMTLATHGWIWLLAAMAMFNAILSVNLLREADNKDAG